MTDLIVPVDATPRSREGSAAPRGSRGGRKWWVLAVLAFSQLMVVLDSTIVNIALPSAQQSLAFSDDQRQWVITAYSLAFGGLLLFGGRLTDRFGRKTCYIAGLVGFAIASGVGGAAQSFGELVAGRAVQGAFAAVLAPAALSLLTTTFTDPKDRGRAFGVFGAVAGSGGAVGLLLGGVLTEDVSWRWCLYVNVVFAAIAVVGAVLLVGKQVPGVSRSRIDLPGAVTVSLGLVGVVYGFSSAASNGWADPRTVIAFAAGVLLLVVFVVIESRVGHPLLPLRVVLHRQRGGSYLTFALVGAGLFGVFLFLTYYLEVLRGYTAVQTGIGFLPMPVAIAISAAVIAPRLLPRVGPKPMIIIGAVLGGVGLLLLNRIGVDSDYWTTVAPGLVVIGLGLGFTFSAGFDAATAGIEPRDAGVASAMVNTAQQIGGSIGTAVLSTIAADTVTRYLTSHAPTRSTVVLAQLDSYHAVFLASASVFLAVAVLGVLLLRWGRGTDIPDDVVPMG